MPEGTPPASPEAECLILGALLTEHDRAAKACKHLLAGEFYNDANRTIYQAVRRLANAGTTPDYLSVCDELLSKGELEDNGGTAYLLHLVDCVFTDAGLRNAVSIVRRCAAKRKIIEATGRTWDRLRKADPDDEDFARAADSLSDLLYLHRITLQPDELDVSPLTATDVRRIQGETEWAWRGWLPCGHLTMVAGEQANMKSALALRIGACFSEGWPWPDGSPFTGQRGKILWIEAESAHGVTATRAASWGMNTDAILFPADATQQDGALVDANLDDLHHRRIIASMAARDDVRVIVLDSLSASSSARDENSSQMLEITRWLAALARDKRLPVILIHHLRKKGLYDSSVVTMERLRGSSAIGQLARSVWACDKPDEHNTDRRLYVIKSTLCAMPEARHGMRMSDTGFVFVDAPEDEKRMGTRDLAAEWLRDELREGPKPASWIMEAAHTRGFSDSTINRAKANLRVASFKRFGETGWFWALAADLDRNNTEPPPSVE